MDRLSTARVIAASVALTAGLAGSAAAATHWTTATHLNCNSRTAHVGRSLHCGVSVSTIGGRGSARPATGMAILTSTAGGSLGNGGRCVLVPVNRRTARCSFVFVAPTGARTATLRAAYAGDATHGSSTASRTVAVRP
ncbi:MAG: hypothetical protein QOE44_3146 [Solirubrobacteraceae bacterium]|jgi:hypothetical protein|nr:hypothetical protein [Solirubrobacteraceae bacterium]